MAALLGVVQRFTELLASKGAGFGVCAATPAAAATPSGPFGYRPSRLGIPSPDFLS
jgi:hypothetical protein